MAAGENATGQRARSGEDDVLRLLRSGTADEHEDVERTLDLLDPGLTPARLVAVLERMHGFWRSAEAGLDAWAQQHPADADRLSWARRRRADLFAADLAALGAPAAAATPDLPPVTGTDEALGRLYVLEGSTLGGTFIDRHLAALPALAGVRIGAFSPYGERTGAMWADFRRATRERVADGGSPQAMLAAARTTFAALAGWCRPATTEVPA